jgi:hypothetical protein
LETSSLRSSSEAAESFRDITDDVLGVLGSCIELCMFVSDLGGTRAGKTWGSAVIAAIVDGKGGDDDGMRIN